MSTFFNKIKNIIFPQDLKCDVCGKEICDVKHEIICDACRKKLPFILHGCIKCGEKIDGEYQVCFACKSSIREFDRAFSVFEYSGIAKQLVWNLKYENAKYLAKTMAGFLTDYIIAHDIKFDVIAYVPVSTKTLQKRGYNQAYLLAREIAKNLNIDLEKEVLLRVKENQSQVDLTAEERANNIANSFIVNKKTFVKGKDMLIIDDVLTTGATLNEIAKVLKKAGANKVLGLTFANTTRKIKFEQDNH